MSKPIPQVLFGCAIDGCAQETSNPPERLFWFEGNQEFESGWYCLECFEHQLDVLPGDCLKDLLDSKDVVDVVFADIRKELRAAIAKFPKWTRDPVHAAAVVNEESGELVRAALQASYEFGGQTNLHTEAIQTAAMAVRFVLGLGLYRLRSESEQYEQKLEV